MRHKRALARFASTCSLSSGEAALAQLLSAARALSTSVDGQKFTETRSITVSSDDFLPLRTDGANGSCQSGAAGSDLSSLPPTTLHIISRHLRLQSSTKKCFHNCWPLLPRCCGLARPFGAQPHPTGSSSSAVRGFSMAHRSMGTSAMGSSSCASPYPTAPSSASLQCDTTVGSDAVLAPDLGAGTKPWIPPSFPSSQALEIENQGFQQQVSFDGGGGVMAQVVEVQAPPLLRHGIEALDTVHQTTGLPWYVCDRLLHPLYAVCGAGTRLFQFMLLQPI